MMLPNYKFDKVVLNLSQGLVSLTPKSVPELVQKIIKLLIFLSLFVPILYIPGIYNPAGMPQTYSFQIIVEVLVFLSLTYFILIREYKPWKIFSKSEIILIALLTLFIASAVISSILGINQELSFWSDFERLFGTITMIHFLLYSLILIYFLRDKKDWINFFKTSVFVALLVCISTLVMNPLYFSNFTRLSGTIDNAGFLGNYLVLQFFIALYIYFQNTKKYIWLISPIFISLFIFFTGTRGAFLGLVCGLFILLLSSIVFYKEKEITIHKHKVSIKIILVGILLVMILVASGLYAITQDPSNSWWVKKSPLNIVQRITFEGGTTRLSFWKIALEGIKEKPLVGWGPGNFETVYHKYYDPILIEYEPRIDRVHNVFLDTSINQGLIGTVIYIGFYIFSLSAILQGLKKKKISNLEGGALLGFFAASLVQNQFLFDTINQFAPFMLVLVFSSKTNALENFENNKLKKLQLSLNPLNSLSILALLLLTIISIGLFNVSDYIIANKYYNELKMPGPSKQQAELLKKSLEKFRVSDLSYTNSYQQAMENGVSSKDLAVTQTYLEIAKKTYEKESPMKHLTVPEITYYSILDKVATSEPAYKNLEIKILQEAIKYSSKRQAAYYLLINTYLRDGDINNAEGTFSELKKVDFQDNPYYISSNIDLLVANKDTGGLIDALQIQHENLVARHKIDRGDYTTEFLDIVRRTTNVESKKFLYKFYNSSYEVKLLSKINNSPYKENYYKLMLINIGFQDKAKALQYLQIYSQIDKNVEYEKIKSLIESS